MEKRGGYRLTSLENWSRRQRLLFAALGYLVLAAGAGWALQGGLLNSIAGVIAMSLAIPMIGYGSRAVCAHRDGPMTRAERRFTREFSLAMPVYFVLVILLWGHARSLQLGWLRALVAVSPALPVAWLVWAMTRLVLQSDEMMQRLHLQALAVSAGVVSVLSMALGFLVAARVLHLDGSILLWVFPVLAWVYGFVTMWLKRRMRGG
ncbi:MAG: hypothetical protein J0H15_04200 [Xanthomonadales bacterium]|nr:hypothetical protein [Xanthomonadales bacterium]